MILPDGAADRRWVLSKVRLGDYLLPSNDAQILWRIARDEGEGWSLWRYADEVSEYTADDLHDWNRWELHESHLPTRDDAVRRSLAIASDTTQTGAHDDEETAE